LPSGVLMGVLGIFVGRMFDAVGARPLLIPGSIIGACGMWGMTTLDATSPLWSVVLGNVLMAVGVGLVMGPFMTSALASLPGSVEYFDGRGQWHAHGPDHDLCVIFPAWFAVSARVSDFLYSATSCRSRWHRTVYHRDVGGGSRRCWTRRGALNRANDRYAQRPDLGCIADADPGHRIVLLSAQATYRTGLTI